MSWLLKKEEYKNYISSLEELHEALVTAQEKIQDDELHGDVNTFAGDVENAIGEFKDQYIQAGDDMDALNSSPEMVSKYFGDGDQVNIQPENINGKIVTGDTNNDMYTVATDSGEIMNDVPGNKMMLIQVQILPDGEAGEVTTTMVDGDTPSDVGVPEQLPMVEPMEALPETPMEAQMEAPVEAPVESVPVEAPVEAVPVEAPVEAVPVEAPTSDPTSDPTGDPTGDVVTFDLPLEEGEAVTDQVGSEAVSDQVGSEAVSDESTPHGEMDDLNQEVGQDEEVIKSTESGFTVDHEVPAQEAQEDSQEAQEDSKDAQEDSKDAQEVNQSQEVVDDVNQCDSGVEEISQNVKSVDEVPALAVPNTGVNTPAKDVPANPPTKVDISESYDSSNNKNNTLDSGGRDTANDMTDHSLAEGVDLTPEQLQQWEEIMSIPDKNQKVEALMRKVNALKLEESGVTETNNEFLDKLQAAVSELQTQVGGKPDGADDVTYEDTPLINENLAYDKKVVASILKM